MSETNFLNLDEIVGVERTIQIKGQKYSVKEVGFGEALKALQSARNAEGMNEAELQLNGIEAMVSGVKQRIPDCPEAVIDSLTATQITAILSWLNEPAEAQAQRLAKEGTKEDAKEGDEAKKA